MRGNHNIGDTVKTDTNIKGVITSIKKFDEMDIIGIEHAGKKIYFSHRQVMPVEVIDEEGKQ